MGNKQECLEDILTILKCGSLQKDITAGVTTIHLCFKAVTTILLVYFLIWSQQSLANHQPNHMKTG